MKFQVHENFFTYILFIILRYSEFRVGVKTVEEVYNAGLALNKLAVGSRFN